MSDNVASDDNDTEEASLTEVKEREREHDVIRGGGDVVGESEQGGGGGGKGASSHFRFVNGVAFIPTRPPIS